MIFDWNMAICFAIRGTCLFGLNAHQECGPVVPRFEYNNLVYAVDLAQLLGI